MLRNSLFAVIIIATLLLSARSAAAQYGCPGQYGQYGGCPLTQGILIDKLVSRPVTKGVSGEFVDNLSSSDSRFGPGSTLFFRLKVKNTSDNRLTGVTVKDFVPSYLEPLQGPGNFDTNSRVITFSAGDFNAGEEKIYDLKMQVVAQNKMPADKGLICVTNRAQAYNSNVSDEDTAQLCIEKQVMGVSQVPSSGPEFGLALVAGQFALLGAGVYLRKRA